MLQVLSRQMYTMAVRATARGQHLLRLDKPRSAITNISSTQHHAAWCTLLPSASSPLPQQQQQGLRRQKRPVGWWQRFSSTGDGVSVFSTISAGATSAIHVRVRPPDQQQQRLSPQSSISDGQNGTKLNDSSCGDSHTASGPAAKRVLYGGHSPTSPWQRAVLAGYSAFSALHNPERADMVATLGEVTGGIALERLYRCMLADPEGREILRARPVINESTIDLAALSALPNGTFGKSYSNFMHGNKFSPDSRSPVHFVDDPDLAYVMRRYREVHDLWHVLSGLPPTVEGELALKWFELVQTGLPVCALGAVFGPLALSRYEPIPSRPIATANGRGAGSIGKEGSREMLAKKYVPWALRAGRRVRKPLICVWYEKRWEQPLEAIRSELGMERAPLRRKEG